jgi:phosphoserine phosphatase
MNELILVNISGEDQPGLTSSITSLLADYDVDVLDVGQAVIHSYLTLGILVRLPGSAESSPILKDILFKAHELGVTVRYTPINDESYANWVDLQGRSRYMLTLLSRKIKAHHIARVSDIVFRYGLNIDNIVRLSGRVPLDHKDDKTKACVEFSLRGESVDAANMRRELMEVANDMEVDIAVQEDNIFRRNRRLIAFDMDSTLIETEVIDELAAYAGVGKEVSEITEKAMAGEFDFSESLEQRVALLKGLDVSVMDEIAAKLPLTEGTEHLFRMLKMLGYKTAILSGGFSFFGRTLKEKLGIDYVYANELDIVDGKLSGKVIKPIVDGERKAELLAQIAEREQISLQQSIAVGDGANDLPMLAAAGLGIAFRAKSIVKQSAEQSISTLGLDGILYLMGIRDRDAQHHK